MASTPHGVIEPTKEKAIHTLWSSMKRLREKDVESYNAILITDNQKAHQLLNAGTFNWELIKDATGKVCDVGIKKIDITNKITPAALHITSDAKDLHLIDGIGEIPADGTSFCTITLKKVDAEGKTVSKKVPDEQLIIRTTGGLVKDAKGKKPIRFLTLTRGEATFRLYSETIPRFVTITVFSTIKYVRPGKLSLEFIGA